MLALLQYLATYNKTVHEYSDILTIYLATLVEHILARNAKIVIPLLGDILCVVYYHTSQGFIQDLELGGRGKQDGSRMIVVCEMHACLLGGGWGRAPQENLGIYIPLRLLLT